MTTTKNKDIALRELADQLILSGSFIENLGLFRGKAGIAIFFFRYARYTSCKWYEEFAGELLDEIYNELSLKTSIDFADGLCGIGWGLEYLVQEGYVEGNTDDVLTNIDSRIMDMDVRRMTNSSFETGLDGIVCYAIMRLHSPRTSDYIPFDEVYWSELREACREDKTTFMGKEIYASGKVMEEILRLYDTQAATEKKDSDWQRGFKMMTT